MQSSNQALPKKALVDAQIACGVICMALLSQQGIQQLAQVLKTAKDPVQVLAHVIFIAIHQADSKLRAKKIVLDHRIYTCDGGVLDRVLFEVMGVLYAVLKYPKAQDPNFVQQVKAATLILMDNNDKARGASQQPDPQDAGQDDGEQEPDADDQGGPQQAQQQQQQVPKGLVAPGGQNA